MEQHPRNVNYFLIKLENKPTWSSACANLLLKGHYGPNTDEYECTWGDSCVQMKVSLQASDQYVTYKHDDERVKFLAKWLCHRIIHTFHGFFTPNSRYREKNDKKITKYESLNSLTSSKTNVE